MGAARNIRRQQQKMAAKGNGHSSPLDQLRDALGGLKQIQDLGQTAFSLENLAGKAQEAQDIVDELKELRGALKEALDYAAECKEELARQRAVFLRLLTQPEPFLGPGDDIVENFLAAESQYRAEYNALLLFVRFLTWVKEPL